MVPLAAPNPLRNEQVVDVEFSRQYNVLHIIELCSYLILFFVLIKLNLIESLVVYIYSAKSSLVAVNQLALVIGSPQTTRIRQRIVVLNGWYVHETLSFFRDHSKKNTFYEINY